MANDLGRDFLENPKNWKKHKNEAIEIQTEKDPRSVFCFSLFLEVGTN